MNVWLIVAAVYLGIIVLHWILLKIFHLMEEKEIQGLAILYLILSPLTLQYSIGKIIENYMDRKLEESNLMNTLQLVLKKDFNIEFASNVDYNKFVLWCGSHVDLDAELDLKQIIEDVMNSGLLLINEEGKYYFK